MSLQVYQLTLVVIDGKSLYRAMRVYPKRHEDPIDIPERLTHIACFECQARPGTQYIMKNKGEKCIRWWVCELHSTENTERENARQGQLF